jgi:L-arabinose transport system substrate-binding protein
VQEDSMLGNYSPRRRGFGVTAAIALVVTTAVALTGCASTSGGASGGDSKKLDFGYVTQLSVQTYFATEAAGAKAEAKKLGVNLEVVDFGGDASKSISQTQTLITQGVDGIGVVPSNTDVGPRLATITKKAGIPLVASDSPLVDGSGKSLPFVGLDNAGSGVQVGTILAREYAQKGWSVDDTYYANVEATQLQACLLRTNAAVKVFSGKTAGFASSHVVSVPYDGTVSTATDAMNAAITAHPNAKHWVITSCNDAGVVGALRSMQSKGLDATNQLGVGLGGDLACQVYTTPYLTAAIPVSTYLDAGSIGATVVQTLYNIVAKHKKVSGNVFVPTPEINVKNFKDKVSCK